MVKTWDRDIYCFPKRRSREGTISFPRKAYREYLASCGLLGKLHITSEMSAKDVRSEICSVFKGPMQNNPTFPFQYLQSTGRGSKSLTIPSQSDSFQWTPQQVACLAGQTGIMYILAEDDLYHVVEESEVPPWHAHNNMLAS